MYIIHKSVNTVLLFSVIFPLMLLKKIIILFFYNIVFLLKIKFNNFFRFIFYKIVTVLKRL